MNWLYHWKTCYGQSEWFDGMVEKLVIFLLFLCFTLNSVRVWWDQCVLSNITSIVMWINLWSFALQWTLTVNLHRIILIAIQYFHENLANLARLIKNCVTLLTHSYRICIIWCKQSSYPDASNVSGPVFHGFPDPNAVMELHSGHLQQEHHIHTYNQTTNINHDLMCLCEYVFFVLQKTHHGRNSLN